MESSVLQSYDDITDSLPTCMGVLASVLCVSSVTETHIAVTYLYRCVGQCVALQRRTAWSVESRVNTSR